MGLIAFVEMEFPGLVQGILSRLWGEGIATVLLGVLVWLLIKAMRWTAPKVEALVAGHLQFLKSTTDRLDRIEQQNEIHAALLKGHTEAQSELRKAVEGFDRTLQRFQALVEKETE